MGTYEVGRYGVIAVATLVSKSRTGKVDEGLGMCGKALYVCDSVCIKERIRLS